MAEDERALRAAAANGLTVSVIVPVWNGEATIAKCLDSLHRQSFSGGRLQLIVVDNGSTDATLDIVQGYKGVLLVNEPLPSSYCARNRGLDHAEGEFVAFTDADCEADPRWIEEGVLALTNQNGVGIAAGHVQMVADPAGPESRAAFLYEQLFAFRQEKLAQMGQSVTANWMSPRRVFGEVGRFDPSLKSGGDMHLSERITHSGLFVRYVPEMVVYHPTRGSIGELASKRRRIVGGMWGRRGARQGFASLVHVMLTELARRTVRTLSASEYSLTDRLRVSILLAALAAVGLTELVRLRFGGEPRRS